MKNAICFVLISLILTSVYAIQVSGNQSGTWTPDDNPYEMIGDVTVPAGTTLTLEPGVIVHAMGLYQITVEGNIIANGTEQDSIYFLSGQIDPNALWDGIRLENETIASSFTNCRIEKADYGINSINSPACISQNHFKYNKRGIQAYGIGSANPAIVAIVENLIEYSQQNAILIAQNSSAYILSNEIRYNGTAANYYGAIQLSNQSANGSNSPTISYNHIHHNYKQGIIAWDIVAANAIQPEVHNNLIENNLTGIYFRHSSGYLHHNTVINNYIPGDMNSGAGIMVSGSTAQPYFEDNIITGNYTGFYLTENAQPCIGNMSIYHMWAQGGNTIANNIDANNVEHSIYCYSYTDGSFTVFAENNFWDYNTAPEIAGTIEDHSDNASLPTIDFAPWQNNPIPIYLAGTVTLPNSPVLTATLELVSADTGNVLNTWTVNINEPFSVPVYHDSLVYIVAHATDDVEQQYYGAYGGTDNPTVTQIIADVQFHIGDLPISSPPPNWYFRTFDAPQMINGHLSYPLKTGWFVYSPTEIYSLFRDNDFVKLSWVEAWQNENHYSFSVTSTPIWMKIDNLDTEDIWEQCFNILYPTQTINTIPTKSEAGITTFMHDEASTYDMIKLGSHYRIDLFDHYENNCHRFWYENSTTYCLESSQRISPLIVEPDGTLFPLAEGNSWRAVPELPSLLPTYFGYKTADSLSFYWIPPRGSYTNSYYRIYDNGEGIINMPMSSHMSTIAIPTDGMEHLYTLSVWNQQWELFCESTITLTFTGNEDEVQPINKLAVYPNPFNPALASLTIKLDASRVTDSKASVYNLKGQLIWNSFVDKGTTEIIWNGKDNNGRICASGLYQMRLTDSKGQKVIRKIMLIR